MYQLQKRKEKMIYLSIKIIFCYYYIFTYYYVIVNKVLFACLINYLGSEAKKKKSAKLLTRTVNKIKVKVFILFDTWVPKGSPSPIYVM